MLKMRKKQGKRQRNMRSIRAVPIFSSCMFWRAHLKWKCEFSHLWFLLLFSPSLILVSVVAIGRAQVVQGNLLKRLKRLQLKKCSMSYSKIPPLQCWLSDSEKEQRVSKVRSTANMSLLMQNTDYFQMTNNKITSSKVFVQLLDK